MGRLRRSGEKPGWSMSSNILLRHKIRLGGREGVREELRKETR